MRISSVGISNFMGITTLTFSPGTVTVLTGSNGTGKSSVLEALRALLPPHTHDPARVRRGAERAVVIVNWDNGHQYRMTIDERATKWELKDERGHKITRVAEHLKSIISSLSLDPVRFLQLTSKEQLATTLATVPLRVSAEDLAFLPAEVTAGIDLDQHALEVIGDKSSGVYGRCYQERTGLNRIVKDKQATYEQLIQTLPDAMDDAQIERDLAVTQMRLNDIADRKHRRMRQVEIEAAEQIAAHRRSAEAAIEDIKKSRDAMLSTLSDESDAIFQELQVRVGQLTERVKAAAGARTTREIAEMHRDQAADAKRQADDLTECLEVLDALRSRLTESLPINGLSVSGGELHVHGVPLRLVNLAERLRVAIAIGRLTSRETDVMLIDDAEHFDAEHLAALETAAKAAGIQCIITRVAEGPLAVNVAESD